MQNYGPLSQYVYTSCGQILKQADFDIKIESIAEDCPNCGASLATTLKRQAMIAPKLDRPKFQTAYDLARFTIDIEKIDELLHLESIGTLCIVGHNANLLLTRLLVRALLPANHGGLNSPNVVVVDAGNKSDFYQTVNFVRQYGLEIKSTLDRIIVSRPFTIYQLRRLLQELSKTVQKYQARAVIIPSLLDLFDDPSVKKKEAKQVIERILKSINDISTKLLVITSMQPNDYAKTILAKFDKRILLHTVERNKIRLNIYNKAKIDDAMITERELKIVKLH